MSFPLFFIRSSRIIFFSYSKFHLYTRQGIFFYIRHIYVKIFSWSTLAGSLKKFFHHNLNLLSAALLAKVMNIKISKW
jgi:hypothetical protein